MTARRVARIGWLRLPAVVPALAATDPVTMEPDHEARQLAEVRQRLEARFPDLDPTVVEAAIQVAAANLTGPVRDFVPLLVEKAARERLARAREGGTDAVGSRPASGAEGEMTPNGA